jgi:Bacterial protein of unknown function (DUF899)
VRRAEPSIQLLGVVVEHRLPKGRLVEDALEDVLVLVHPPHDRVEERAVKDEPEVLEVVVARAVGELLVGAPRLLELIEEELVGLAELEAEPLVHDVDDPGEVLRLGLVLRPAAGEDRHDLAPALLQRARALIGLRDLEVRELDDGTVYYAYSTQSRGVEFLMGYYAILDRVPNGRDEGDSPAPDSMTWIRRHDEYEDAGSGATN